MPSGVYKRIWFESQGLIGWRGILKRTEASVRHGHARAGRVSKTYKTWAGMIQRCENPRSSGYFKYGARGISVCERWHDFKNFLNDMGKRPRMSCLHRVNHTGGYDPLNCVWMPKSAHARLHIVERWENIILKDGL